MAEGKKHLYVGILTRGWIREELHLTCTAMRDDPRYRVTVTTSWDRPTPSNRVQIAQSFMKSDADYMLQIDADTWPYKSPLELMETGLDVIAFPYPILRQRQTTEPPIVISLTPLDDEQRHFTVGEGMVQVKRGGGGAFMVHRRVFEKLPRPWFGYDYDEDGIVTRGADVKFFDDAREAGFEVWAAMGYMHGHSKEVDLAQLAASVKEWKVK